MQRWGVPRRASSTGSSTAAREWQVCRAPAFGHTGPRAHTCPDGQLDAAVSALSATELPALKVVGDSVLATATRAGEIWEWCGGRVAKRW